MPPFLQPHEVVRTRCGRRVRGDLIEPEAPLGVVLIGHERHAQRADTRNRSLARSLAAAGLAVFSFDLLEGREARDPTRRYEVERLSDRFVEAIRCVRTRPALAELPIGLFGTGAGAAGALRASAQECEAVRAVVCCEGRPDLAGDQGSRCTSAVLYIVAGQDERLLSLNAATLPRFGAIRRLEIVEGASPTFQEPGAFEAMTFLTESWFLEHLNLHVRASADVN